MPGPAYENLHISQVLTDLSFAYMQDDEQFVGQQIAPLVPFPHETDQYDIIGKESMLLIETETAPLATPAMIEWNLSQGTATVDYHRLTAQAPFHKIRGASGSIGSDNELKNINTQNLTTYMLRGHEYRVMDACVGSGTTFSGTTLAGNDQWDSGVAASSLPIDDVQTAVSTILTGCQKKPNYMIISWPVFQKLMLNAQIQNYVSFNGQNPIGHAHLVNETLLAELFDIDNVIVASAQYINATWDAVESTTASFLWGKHCWIGYVDDAVSKRIMSAMKTFVFPWLQDGVTPVVQDYTEAPKHKWDTQEICWAYVVKVTATGAGYYIKDCVS